ncbi:MAG: Gmad2 immunoglobulin-like domain-containing protein [Actinomycetota bacterium]
MTGATDGRDLTAVEARLRDALAGHAGGVEPGDERASLARIESRLRAASAGRRRRTSALAPLALAAAVALVLGAAALLDDGDGERLRTVAPDGTTTTSTTAGTTTTTTTTVAAPEVVADAVWPPEGHAPFDDPVDAARSLAEEYVGLQSPRLSAFRALGASSGEVDVSIRRENGTYAVAGTVSVAEAGGHWSVTSARATDIVVDNPKPLGTVGSPVVVDGRARGYEGNVVIDVREAGMGAASSLAQEAVIAGCCEELLPFRAELDLAPRTKANGSVLLATEAQFTIVPIRFGPTP